MSYDNPTGTNGFAFLEFTTKDTEKLKSQFKSMGFALYAKHQTKNISIYKQNDIHFIINATEHTSAASFADKHGASVCAMGFFVTNAEAAHQHALRLGAESSSDASKHTYDIPAIQGVGNSMIYFVDTVSGSPNYLSQFMIESNYTPSNTVALTYLDHVTHNLYRGNMIKWADFYTRIFNFREVRYFDIEGRVTGLKSKAMTSACGKIRIPLNESADDQSQIEEFLKEFHGEGIQHIALGTSQIYDSVDKLRDNGIHFLDTPDTYYDLIENRLPHHGEPVENLKKLRILIDGNTQTENKLLLQIFTQNMLGPVFFEIIQRKGDEGFGEGNFRALFESIELDQIRRGVVRVEE
jgi:4-hydroxyphenylpyruvate dioxygenase